MQIVCAFGEFCMIKSCRTARNRSTMKSYIICQGIFFTETILSRKLLKNENLSRLYKHTHLTNNVQFLVKY